MMFSASSGFAQSAESGSVVLFSDYASRPTMADCDDTFFALTNSHPSQRAFVRVLFVNRIDLSAEEYTVCLPALQSVSWHAGELDPGVYGFAYAIATDSVGRPTEFNWLSGTFSRQTNFRQEAWRNAVSLPKLSAGTVMPVNGVSTISFDGQMYIYLPSHLAEILPEVSVRAFPKTIGCASKFIYRINSVIRD